MRRRFLLSVVSVALSACSGQAIVFHAVANADDAGPHQAPDAAKPPPDACPTMPYIVEAGAGPLTGSLELTEFEVGSARLPLLATGPDGQLWFTSNQHDVPTVSSLDRLTSAGIATEVRKAG